jgi:hypothetical protein
MLVGAVGVFIGFTFRNPVMFGVGFFLVCVGYTLHMRAYIRYIYSDKILLARILSEYMYLMYALI